MLLAQEQVRVWKVFQADSHAKGLRIAHVWPGVSVLSKSESWQYFSSSSLAIYGCYYGHVIFVCTLAYRCVCQRTPLSCIDSLSTQSRSLSLPSSQSPLTLSILLLFFPLCTRSTLVFKDENKVILGMGLGYLLAFQEVWLSSSIYILLCIFFTIALHIPPFPPPHAHEQSLEKKKDERSHTDTHMYASL